MHNALDGMVERLPRRRADAHFDGEIIDGKPHHDLGGGELAQTGGILFGSEYEFAVALELLVGFADTLDVGE